MNEKHKSIFELSPCGVWGALWGKGLGSFRDENHPGGASVSLRLSSKRRANVVSPY